MSDQLDALIVVVGRLDAMGIRYRVSGSTAMNFHARPRMTRDIDIVIELIERDMPALVASLSDDVHIDEERHDSGWERTCSTVWHR